MHPALLPHQQEPGPELKDHKAEHSLPLCVTPCTSTAMKSLHGSPSHTQPRELLARHQNLMKFGFGVSADDTSARESLWTKRHNLFSDQRQLPLRGQSSLMNIFMGQRGVSGVCCDLVFCLFFRSPLVPLKGTQDSSEHQQLL